MFPIRDQAYGSWSQRKAGCVLLISLLVTAMLVAFIVSRMEQPANQSVVVGRAMDFPAGSITGVKLATTLYDPMRPPVARLAGTPSLLDRLRYAWKRRFPPPVGRVSPVPLYLVHDHQAGWLALYKRDTHSSCAVVWLPDDEQFVDPCHGTRYGSDGTYVRGPGPRGLDRFPVAVTSGGDIVVNGTVYIPGPPAR